MKFFLDGILLNDEPVGDIITTIKRDSQLGGFLITNDAKLSFHGDGFDAIQAKIDTNGFCGELDLDIYDDYNNGNILIFKGKIFLLEITKTNNDIITTPVQDNNFYARINKNRGIKTFINSTQSKNQQTIDAAKINRITMFNPVTGSATAGQRYGYRVYDCFKNVIAFISDNEVEFDSTLFGLNGDFEGLSVIMGASIMSAQIENPIQMSFQELYDEVKKKMNVVFYIDTTGAKPIIRLERYGDIFLPEILKRFDNIDKVSYRVDNSKLIAKVSVGSSTLIDVVPGNRVSMVESSRYNTFKQEEYTLLEQCNTDSVMDLVSNWIISSNCIEDALINGSDANSEGIFLIDTVDVVDNTTYYSSVADESQESAAPYFYNERLYNSRVLKRWSPLLPNSVANFSGDLNETFRASSTTTITTSVAVLDTEYEFSDDTNFPNYDTGGNYDNSTYRYSAPSDGTYVFVAQLKYKYTEFPGSGSTNTGEITFNLYDSGGALKSSDIHSISATTEPFNNYTIHLWTEISSGINMAATDYVSVSVLFNTSALGNGILTIYGDEETYFACTQTPDDGGVVLLDEGEAAIIKADFEYPVPNQDFMDILAQPFKRLAITYPYNKVKYGWIDTFKFNHNTGSANITLTGTSDLLK